MEDSGANTISVFSRHCSRLAPPIYGSVVYFLAYHSCCCCSSSSSSTSVLLPAFSWLLFYQPQARALCSEDFLKDWLLFLSVQSRKGRVHFKGCLIMALFVYIFPLAGYSEVDGKVNIRLYKVCWLERIYECDLLCLEFQPAVCWSLWDIGIGHKKLKYCNRRNFRMRFNFVL